MYFQLQTPNMLVLPIKSIIKNINQNRKNQLIDFLFKTESNKNETHTDKKEVKKIPKFKKFERRISDENLKYKGNPETNENNNDIKASTNRLNKFGDNINNDQDKENVFRPKKSKTK